MKKIKKMTKVVGKYQIPSSQILHNRRVFYNLQRKDAESSQKWFGRVQNSVNACEFPKFTEYFLIDKFVSDLKTDEIEFIRKTNTWSLIPSSAKTTMVIGEIPIEPALSTGSSSNRETSIDSIVDYDNSDRDPLKLKTNTEETCAEDHTMPPSPKISDCKNYFTGQRALVLKEEEEDPLAESTENTNTIDIDEETCVEDSIMPLSPKKSDCEKVADTTSKKESVDPSEHQNRSKYVRVINGRYICELCQRTFSDTGGLWRHEKRNCQGIRSVTCKICGKCFAYLSRYQKHAQIHEREERQKGPHPCDICEKIYKNIYNLENHQKFSHEGVERTRKFGCKVCDKNFTHSYLLRKHLDRHTIDRSHQCDQCDKSFKVLSDLNAHKRIIHQNIRPHCCEFCGKRFSMKGNLDKHLRIHRGDRPYTCDVEGCKKSFNQSSSLNRHKGAIH